MSEILTCISVSCWKKGKEEEEEDGFDYEAPPPLRRHRVWRKEHLKTQTEIYMLMIC